MILEKQEDGWWVFEYGDHSAGSDKSDLDAFFKAWKSRQRSGPINEPLADEIYAALARNRNCSNCNRMCPGSNTDWGCSEWIRRTP